MRWLRAAAPAALAILLVAGCAAAPSASPVASPSPTAAPTPSPTPSPLPTPSPSPTPTPSPTPSPSPSPAGRPTRVAVPSLGIDLPVVNPPKNSTWPLCDVAEFFKPPVFQHPGAGGVTYIYGHAQEGMFLPILSASKRRNGKALLGETITVWSNRNHRYTYEITEVRRRQKTLAWAFDLPANSLVVQTSEDQYRTGTKVMLVARQVGGPELVADDEAHPKPKPRVCGR